MNTTKSFNISKQVVWKAYKRVKANKGAAGVDEETIKDFEKNLKDNLYKIWNRMSSGSYVPPPVRMVEIPKKDKGSRVLGVACVSDRVAQTVVKMYLEPEIEPHFYEDSYGYRPGKSALDAVGKARERCWRYDWVLDLDIQKFYDTIDRELLMRAVRKHTNSKWIILYIERWLKAPIKTTDGQLQFMEKGVFQGNVISPLLANLFLHYALDVWLKRNYPNNPYERYADDELVHCRTLTEAKEMWVAIERRLAECGLKLHSEKTKIVYCKDGQRKLAYHNKEFDFLGFTFRARTAKTRWGKMFTNFSPAISDKAIKDARNTIRTWCLPKCTGHKVEELAQIINPITRGWIGYYGSFYKSKLASIFWQLDYALVRWAEKKYKRLKGSRRNATKWLKRIATQEPTMFAHWQITYQPK